MELLFGIDCSNSWKWYSDKMPENVHEQNARK